MKQYVEYRHFGYSPDYQHKQIIKQTSVIQLDKGNAATGMWC